MRHHAETALEDPRLRNLTSNKVCASIVLQQLLYFQTFFSICWLIFWIVWLFSEYWQGLSYADSDVVRTVTLVFWGISEPIRLSAGWYGNLQENVPWLVLFCILTLVPTHATCYYIMLASQDVRPYNQAVQVAQAILMEFEVIFGIYAVRRMYRLQKEQYYLFEYAMGQRRRALKEARTTQQMGAGKRTRAPVPGVQ